MLRAMIRRAERVAEALSGLLPAPLHRALLPLAFRLRDRWRRWRGTRLVGCAVVITNRAGDVLLLRHSYGPKGWALPGGGVGPGEDPQEAARREVREELGLELDGFEPLAAIEEEISGSPLTAHLFAALATGDPVPDGREVIEARFFPPNSLPEPLGRLTRGRLAHWRRHDCAGSAGAP
ncbi:MAG: NUDIX domain-containing protein [Erythrobacter sp.]|jgi:ADP-ribose pyrophosphatase YjhB (NUDIX family)|nr:NUDIX domain-containing protein [Erythrobacter sp.]